MTQRPLTSPSLHRAVRQASRYVHRHAARLKRRALIGLVAGFVVAFSLPQTYTAEVVTVPKSTWNRRSVARRDLLKSLLSGESVISNPDPDAFRPTLYPYITASKPFLCGLFDVPLRLQNDSTLSLADYVNHHQRVAWWYYLPALPGYALSAVKSLFTEPRTDAGPARNDKDSIFRMTKRDRRTAGRIYRCLKTETYEDKFAVAFRARLQDPVAAALLADAFRLHMQSYLQTYRDRKAQLNLAYCDSLFRQARREYYAAQEAEAAYRDTHRHLHGYTAREPQRRLALLRQEAYRNYVATEQSLREAQERVAAVTPLFTVITPAEVPLHPDGPARPWVVLACTLLGAASLPLGSWIARRLRRLRYWKRRRSAHRSRPTNPASTPTATEPALNPTAR